MKRSVLCGAVTLVLACAAFAADPVRLPEPAKNGGAALLDCLSARRAGRVFSGKVLSGQELSDLLWATGGVSSGEGKLTYPTAQDVRDIVIYVFTASGVSRYDAGVNALMPVLSGDHRGDGRPIARLPGIRGGTDGHFAGAPFTTSKTLPCRL